MEYRYNFVLITPHKEIILGAKGNDFLLEFPQVVVESDYMVSTLDVIRTYFPTVKLFSFGQWLERFFWGLNFVLYKKWNSSFIWNKNIWYV